MTLQSPDIAALIGSRICHDLISPIGAISNGVELLEMAGGAAGPEIELISESVVNANARIRFFRVAFGAASSGQMIGASEVRSILADYSAGGRLRLDWQAGGDQVRAEAKIAFLLILCLETAMPWGGKITVGNTGGIWSVFGGSDRIKVDNALWGTLLTPNPNRDISAAEVQFLLLPTLLRDADRSLSLDIGETAISARF